MEIQEKLLSILEDNGIYIDRKQIGDDIGLREYIADSLQFISFIVEIENSLNIEFPDEILLFDKIASLNGFSNAIKSILSGEYAYSKNLIQDYESDKDFFEGEINET